MISWIFALGLVVSYDDSKNKVCIGFWCVLYHRAYGTFSHKQRKAGYLHGILVTCSHQMRMSKPCVAHTNGPLMPLVTPWGRDNKVIAILQIIFKYIWNQNICILIKISVKFVLVVSIKNVPTLSKICLAPNRRHVIIKTNHDILYWRIIVSLGLNEITPLWSMDCSKYKYTFLHCLSFPNKRMTLSVESSPMKTKYIYAAK